jgi:hypothetical protein
LPDDEKPLAWKITEYISICISELRENINSEETAERSKM